jgi:chromate transporter
MGPGGAFAPPEKGSQAVSPADGPPAPRERPLRELAALFLKLGTIAFGGPAAHVAMMRHEVVTKRRWLDDRRFLDLLAAANVIPGPTSTELAIHVGFERGRWLGLVVAGAAFILPAMLITAACGWLYVAYGSLPEVAGVLYGIKPVMVVIVMQAIVGLAPAAARSAVLRIVGLVALVALLLGVGELVVLFATGAVMLVARGAPHDRNRSAACLVPFLPFGAAAGAASVSAAATASGLFAVFFKIGSVLFGSGYVLLAFLRADLVERLGWLTEAQLLDAIAVGQVTPGPVFTTATFIGYVLDGPTGACAATAGIFLPAFLFVAFVGPFVPRLRASPRVAAFLDGVTVASLALMADVTFRLFAGAVTDAWTIAIAAVAALLLLRWKVNPTWLIAGGALVGWLVA